VTGHWDSALGNFNNDVLYFEKSANRWKIITWDMDNTFDYELGSPQKRYNYDGGGKRAVFDKIFSIAEVDRLFKERVSDYLNLVYRDRDDGELHKRLSEVKRTVEGMNGSLDAAEKQNTALSQEMQDYMTERYLLLRGVVGR